MREARRVFITLQILLFLPVAVFLPVASQAADTTLTELMAASVNSPVVGKIAAEKDVAKAASKFVSSYHYPVLSIGNNFRASNNPVDVFASKLMQEDFGMQDFAIDALNNPDYRRQNTTSFSLMVPIYLGGEIGNREKATGLQQESLEYKKNWATKVVKGHIYTLYHLVREMDGLEKFLTGEKKYLERLLGAYGAKSSANRNRYLAYNQGRIILSSMDESLNMIRAERTKAIESLGFLTGLEISGLDLEATDPLEGVKWESLEIADAMKKREDLKSYKAYVGALDSEIKAEKGRWLPKIVGFANYNISTHSFKTFGDDFTAGLALKLDLALSNDRAVGLASAKKMKVVAEMSEAEKKAMTDMKKQRLELESISKRLALRDDRNKRYMENKSLLTRQYSMGSMNLYNLLENFAHYLRETGEMHSLRIKFRSMLASFVLSFPEKTDQSVPGGSR